MAETPKEERRKRRRLPEARRITQSRDIRGLFRRGKRRKTAHLDVVISSSPVAYARVGVVVPKHRHTIVERNRLKRRLREVLRHTVLPRLDAAGLRVDVLVRARSEAYEATYDELRIELEEWVEWACSDASSSR